MKLFVLDSNTLIYLILFVLRPATGEVRHKAILKVGPEAGPQLTCVRQNPKMPSAPSAFPQWGCLRRQEIKQQTIGKTINLFNGEQTNELQFI